jgi:hypothetical protein
MHPDDGTTGMGELLHMPPPDIYDDMSERQLLMILLMRMDNIEAIVRSIGEQAGPIIEGLKSNPMLQMLINKR